MSKRHLNREQPQRFLRSARAHYSGAQGSRKALARLSQGSRRAPPRALRATLSVRSALPHARSGDRRRAASPPGAMGIADKLRSLSLPGNWQVRTDEEGNQFYWNSHTFKKQSTRPKALGLGWREQRDHETGEVFIYNILTRQSQAAPPERQVHKPPPEIVPPPPTMEMYEESVKSRRQTTSPGAASERDTVVSVRTSSMRDPNLPTLHTPRAAAKAGVPVTVDPFSLRNRTGCKTLSGPAWPSCAQCQPACDSSAPAEMTVLLPKLGARWCSSQAGTENGAELKPPGPPPGSPPGGPPGALPAGAESDSPGGSGERATAKAGQQSPQTSAVRASRPRPSHPPSTLRPFAPAPRPALAPVRPPINHCSTATAPRQEPTATHVPSMPQRKHSLDVRLQESVKSEEPTAKHVPSMPQRKPSLDVRLQDSVKSEEGGPPAAAAPLAEGQGFLKRASTLFGLLGESK